jgi:hypothetical protein
MAVETVTRPREATASPENRQADFARLVTRYVDRTIKRIKAKQAKVAQTSWDHAQPVDIYADEKLRAVAIVKEAVAQGKFAPTKDLLPLIELDLKNVKLEFILTEDRLRAGGFEKERYDKLSGDIQKGERAKADAKTLPNPEALEIVTEKLEADRKERAATPWAQWLAQRKKLPVEYNTLLALRYQVIPYFMRSQSL